MDAPTTMPSTFDPDTFLNASVDTAFETRRTTVPANDRYLGIIDTVKPRAAKDRIILDIFWAVQDDALKASLNMQKVIVRQSVFLDFDETGKLAKGVNQNVQLGQVRDALNQNSPGVPWSPRLLIGAGPAMLKVSERPDDKNPLIKYNDVDRVSKLSVGPTS